MSTDARRHPAGEAVIRLCRLLPAVLMALSFCTAADGANYRSSNFVVQAPTAELARAVGETAEKWRKKLALDWLGKEMPQWYRPCTVKVRVGQIGAGGATTFSFDRGHVVGWKMRVQGTRQRILDSVVPHEVSHTVFASYFRRPLPRWADEGAATLVEHESEKRVQQLRLKQAVQNRRHISLRRLLPMKEYPRDMRQVLLLYAEGFSLADFLVQNGGRKTYLTFLDDAHRDGWNRALKRHYGFPSIEHLEKKWKGWFLAGSPRLNMDAGEAIAAREADATNRDGLVVRSQNPEAATNVRPPLPTNASAHASSPTAPDPRRGGRHHSTATPRWTSTPTAGRLKTLNDGWIPIKRRRSTDAASETATSRTAFLPLFDEHRFHAPPVRFTHYFTHYSGSTPPLSRERDGPRPSAIPMTPQPPFRGDVACR